MERNVVSFGFSTFLVLFLVSHQAFAQCSRWDRIESDPVVSSHDWFTAVSYGGGTFLVTEPQELYTSDDGWNWSRVWCGMSPGECLIARRFEAVTWNGSEFIAIGNSGHDRVYRISDNRLEIAGDCPGGFYLGIGFNGARYVAVGDHSLATSADAETWSYQPGPQVNCPCFSETVRMTSVAWNGTMWIAVGHVSCGGVVLTSQDGWSWELQEATGSNLQSVASDGDLTVAVGDVSIASPDGLSWTVIPDLPLGMRTVTWSGSEWYAAGMGGTIYSSPDGTVWEVAGPSNGCLDEMVAGEETIVAVGLQTMTRYDPQQGWTDLAWRVPEAAAVMWDGSRFVAAGRSRVHASVDGRHWQRLQCGMTRSVHDAAWDGRTYVGVGTEYVGWAGQKIPIAQSSTDGVIWAVVELPAELFDEERGFRAITYGDGSFLVIGDDVVVTTEDGSAWQVFPFDHDAYDVVWDGARYVALASTGALLSDDGVSWDGPHEIWDQATADLDFHDPRMATDGGTYVVVQPDGALSVSENATTWAKSTVDSDSPVADVVWTGEDWAAVTLDEQILVSSDGAVWRRESVPWVPLPYAPPPGGYPIANRFRLAVGGDRVVAVAEDLVLIRNCTPPSPRHSGRRAP